MNEHEYLKEELNSLSAPEDLHKLAEQFLSGFFRELPNGPFRLLELMMKKLK